MEVVRIAQLADDSTSTISHRQFEDVEIRGPAVLAPLMGVAFIDSVFEGSFDTMVIVVDDGAVKQGIIGLQQVSFRRCRFRNVALIGTSEFAQQFGQHFLREPEDDE